MAKAFLLGLFGLFFTAILVLFAYQFNMLPVSVYPFAYKLMQSFPFLAPIPPSFEKFEGTWAVTFTPRRPQSDIGTCDLPSGSLHVHAGKFTGAVGFSGPSVPITANTTDDGRLTGIIGNASTVRKGTLVADIQNGVGRGVWEDGFECDGTVLFTKQQAVIDPVQGRVVSAGGDSKLLRNGEIRPLLPGMLLYVGDTIEARDGTVLLSMGAAFETPVDLTSSMTYKVGQ